MTDTGDYYVTHTVHTFDITCNARACNNFEFTFKLMTVGCWTLKDFTIWLYQEQRIF